MATPSPGHRLRTKTSDITDFFRAGSSRSRAADADDAPSSPTFLSEPESPVRKRSSKIPFLGRQRKKSTHSDASTSASSAGPSSRQSDSEARHSSASRKATPRPEVPIVPPLDERPLPSLPPTSPSPSLGSKLVAHFAPSRQKLLNISPRKPARSPTNELPPSVSSRGTSTDSTSSDHRSNTPRPAQPIITVSLPPDNLEGYEGMFTLPKSSSPTNVAEDPQLTPTASTSSTPPLRFPTPQPSDSRDAEATVTRRGSRTTPDERSSSRASRISRKHIGSTFRQVEVDSTDAEDSEAVMSDSPKASPPMNAGPTPIVEKRRTLATMPYNFSEKASQPRSIMKSTSDRPARPPAFPPPPPPTNPPSSALPVIPSQTMISRKSNDSPPLGSSASRRQRAQTLSAVPSSPLTLSTPSSSPATIPSRRITKSICEGSASTSASGKKVVDEPSGKENFDLETASADQLRQALTLRNQQFDELASYLLKITEAHVAEKHALLRKIASLEQDATRKENEIKGLTWLVTNNTRPGSSGSIGMLNTASKSTGALQLEQAADKQPSGGKLTSSFSHSNPAEDSGAESHQTTSGAEESYRESGAESIWGSGTSGGESSSSDRARKVKRNHTLMSSFYRTSMKGQRPGGEPAAQMTLPYSPSPSTKRSSVSSFGSSSASSTSSLSLGTLTPATTVTSLSAIPETAGSAPRSQDPAVAAAILATENQREKEERRASRTSNRLSASSVNTPSASAAYSANLKRARPPSIAQVLAQSPKMEHGRDKLRSYGTSGSASS
ncbi:hypothetical protein C8R44DRAFT_735523 [Mycena epipterygia]|nr:hypothetical protein C8R44DRAFT_735523 [Mycena epipterygia]